ncbi:Transmembrane protein 41 homolog [Coccomyxa sp. Obi]|nr:Transmembrane protein 41 homolog [Coccomyxa sp. Obi]
MCLSAKLGEQHRAWACRKPGLAKKLRIWHEAKRSILIALGIAAVLLTVLATYAQLMPPLPAGDWATLRQFPPLSISQLAAQRDVVQNYAAEHLVATLIGWTLVYVFMQMFAIPGTVSLSLLSGALFGTLQGLFLVAVVSTLGSCACFMLSRLVGKSLAHAVWPDQLKTFEQEVQKRKGDLLNYIIFLRVTPLLPNIFINIASPVVNVPIFPFALGTLIGCLPNNFLAVNAGSKLGELKAFTDLYDAKILLVGCGVGVVAVFPIVWKHLASRREQQQQQKSPNAASIKSD